MKKVFFLLSLFYSPFLIGQTTIVLQPGPSEGKDAKIFNIGSLQNYGSDLDFIAATWTFGGEPGTLRSLIQFDLSSIPPGAGIVDARLSLFYNFVTESAGQAGNNAAFLKRITENWDENSVNWSNQPAFTNANQISLPESTSSDQDYENIDVAPLIRDMIEDPSHSFGFLFIGQVEAVLSSMKFFSSDALQKSQRPKLEITYINNPIQCITIQPGNEGKDAKVFSLESGTNYGNDIDFIAAAWTFGGSNGLLRSCIDFDLSGLPQNAQILSADLSLYYNNFSSSAGQAGINSAVLQRIVEPWNEQTITWNNQPASVHSNEVVLPTSTSMNQDYTNINVTSLITDMISNPGSSYGLMIKQVNEEIFRSMKFCSSDCEDSNKHPKLEICYTLSTSNQEIDINRIDIHPNPFDQSFIIHGLLGQYEITIWDLNGKQVYSSMREDCENGVVISGLDNIPSGIYFVIATGKNGNYASKIVK